MTAAVNVIGVISGLMTMVSFADTYFGSTEAGSTIKVAVALDNEAAGTTNAGGDLPDVRVWNDFGDYLSMTADPGTVSDGTVGTVEVYHDQQGAYSLFSANDDAICIAWVTTTWSDAAGGNKYAVSGDYGYQCGASWYWSNMYTNSDRDYQPRCFWIDKNGDQPQTGFQVRWPRFAESEYDDSNRDPNQVCNDIDFGLRTEYDPSYINYWVKSKRSEVNDRRIRARAHRAKRAPWTKSQLVLTDSDIHSARELCESETSMGPDFAHTGEKVFCDMEEKKLYPFCDGANTTSSCFDFENAKVVGNGALAARDDVVTPYSRVRDWRAPAAGSASAGSA
ncbi:hypothetical protein BJX61DRAFT_546071 [Aspergillus egyptiacus]|nr:hypothetical protein BJX61DRAFT_546071 [Aspergillus egyptiacus]